MRPRPILAMLLACLLLAACAGIKYSDQPQTQTDLTEARSQSVGTRVLAKADEWRNSGVLVRKGVAYTVTASGRWRMGGFCGWTEPDGLGVYNPLCPNLGNAPVKGWSIAALVARVGEKGAPFGVGKALTFTAQEDGVLYFINNDVPGFFWDNEGYADVTIALAGAGSPAPALAAAPAAATPEERPGAKKAVPAQASAPATPAPQPLAQAEPAPPAPAAQAVAAQAAPFRGRRVALVIGNGAYPTAPLRNPVNDARDMAQALKSLGFEVILRENASLQQMEGAVDDLWSRLRQGGAGLFFFAGHGLQVGGRNYLVPVDARMQAEQDVKYRAMDAGLVLGRMENAGNGLNIVILDACRNNPFARSFRSAAEGLAKMDAPKGSLIAYATAPDSVAADGQGRNGIYTGQLLRHLRTPGIGIEELFKRVRIGVLSETSDRQVPWESSSLTGYFTFNESGK